MLHSLNLGCSFITLREVINDVFQNERTFLSHLSSKGEALRWEMTEKRPRVLKNIFNYFIAILYS